MSLEIPVTFKSTICCIQDCHISFAIPSAFYDQRLKDKKTFYCPRGHPLYFIDKSEEEKLKDEVRRLEIKIDYVRSCKRRVEYARRHWKGEVTKLKKKG